MKGSWFIFDTYRAHEDWCRWRAPFWHGSRVLAEESHHNYHLGFRCCKTIEEGGARRTAAEEKTPITREVAVADFTAAHEPARIVGRRIERPGHFERRPQRGQGREHMVDLILSRRRQRGPRPIKIGIEPVGQLGRWKVG